jgi:mannan endo-1,6-alpha-mannosidase
VFRANKDKDNTILVETPCEQTGKCNTDQRAFKGIFARSLARAALAAPIVAEPITKMLSISAKAAAAACTTDKDTACGFSWADPESEWSAATVKDGNLGEVFNALEIVQGLLYPSAKALRSVKGAGSGNGSATQSGSASKASSSGPAQATGAASTTVASFSAMMLIAFAAVLSC